MMQYNVLNSVFIKDIETQQYLTLQSKPVKGKDPNIYFRQLILLSKLKNIWY